MPIGYNPTVYTSPIVLQDTVVDTSTIKNVLVPFYADYYGVSVAQLQNTIKCESGFNPTALGDHGTSFGLAQLHYPASKGITLDEAYNPYFAIDYMARGLKYHTDTWSCTGILGYNAP